MCSKKNIPLKKFATVTMSLNALYAVLELIRCLAVVADMHHCRTCEELSLFGLAKLSGWITLILCAMLAMYGLYKDRPKLLVYYLALLVVSAMALLLLIFLALVNTVVDFGLRNFMFYKEDQSRYRPRTMLDVWCTLIILKLFVLLNIYFTVGTFFEECLIEDKLSSMVNEENLLPFIRDSDTDSTKSWQTSRSWKFFSLTK